MEAKPCIKPLQNYNGFIESRTGCAKPALAEQLGNVSEASRRRGMTRTQFYEYKKRFQVQGFEGLKDLPPIHKSHPFTTPPEIVDKVLALSLKHPSRGCNHLEALLVLDGVSLSAITIQKILNEHGLGTKMERWLALEKQHLQEGSELSTEHLAYIEKLNPVFKERHVESAKPGEFLSKDAF